MSLTQWPTEEDINATLWWVLLPLGVWLVTMYIIVYGAALLDHALLGAGFDERALIGDINGKYYQWCKLL